MAGLILRDVSSRRAMLEAGLTSKQIKTGIVELKQLLEGG